MPKIKKTTTRTKSRRSKPTRTALGFNITARDSESALVARVRIKTGQKLTVHARNGHAAGFADEIMKAVVNYGRAAGYGFRLSTMRVRRSAR